nr:uncharacterized protein LOC127308599 [Lolium perenne]XP_051195423.1 uncharacterized protein LOC127308599 [Lolium perenne]
MQGSGPHRPDGSPPRGSTVELVVGAYVLAGCLKVVVVRPMDLPRRSSHPHGRRTVARAVHPSKDSFLVLAGSARASSTSFSTTDAFRPCLRQYVCTNARLRTAAAAFSLARPVAPPGPMEGVKVGSQWDVILYYKWDKSGIPLDTRRQRARRRGEAATVPGRSAHTIATPWLGSELLAAVGDYALTRIVVSIEASMPARAGQRAAPSHGPPPRGYMAELVVIACVPAPSRTEVMPSAHLGPRWLPRGGRRPPMAPSRRWRKVRARHHLL